MYEVAELALCICLTILYTKRIVECLYAGSNWESWSSPGPLYEHSTLLLHSHSMDRSAGIGFRCVQDLWRSASPPHPPTTATSWENPQQGTLDRIAGIGCSCVHVSEAQHHPPRDSSSSIDRFTGIGFRCGRDLWRSPSLPFFPPQQQHDQIHSNSIYIGQRVAWWRSASSLPQQQHLRRNRLPCVQGWWSSALPLSTTSGWTGPRAGQRDRLWMYLEVVIHCLQFSCCPFFLCTKLTSRCLQYRTRH